MIDPIQHNEDAFVDQLRSMRPISVPNVQETFYRSGWEAAMRHQNNALSLAPVTPKTLFRFSWGLSGLATGVVLMLSIQSIELVRNSKHQGQAPVIAEKRESNDVASHNEFNGGMAAVQNDSAKKVSHPFFVAADSTRHAPSIILQREELINELTGSLRGNRVSKFAMRNSESTLIYENELESNVLHRNELLDEEMQQLLRIGNQSSRVY